MTPAFVVSAPASGSGKTILTLGLLRAFRDAGLVAGSAKIGPDYIDPRFHEAASGRASPNLDGWAMRRDRILALAAKAGQGADILVVEGVMGLFDRPSERGLEGRGGAAEIARMLGAPVVMVVDASGAAQSVGALTAGFAKFDPTVAVAGVILNRVASPRHEALLREGCAEAGIAVLGAVPRTDALKTPSRHLGLVQAEEVGSLEALLGEAGRRVAAHVDLDAIRSLARPSPPPGTRRPPAPMPAIGRRIAVASDVAFRFAYPHVLDAWREEGVSIETFSPLADEAPSAGCDAVFLPGGYPELHAARLSAATRFREGMQAAAGRGDAVYGECGGYMALGERLIDADGVAHPMLGLLPLETTFARRKLHLGYRDARLVAAGPLGPAAARFLAHEFHYASIEREGEAAPLFKLPDGSTAGLSKGAVSGSFLHLIDRA